jgi:multiple sugar transport system ATP-binding protein
VAMGRAIVRDPKVFLFDEPLSNLDAKLRVQMRAEIKALQQRLNTTTVYVTHDQIEAMTMADKIVVLNAGKVEQIGSPLELYDHPVNMFVAGFLGSPAMNFLEGTARNNSHPGITLADGSVIQLDAVPATAGGNVVLGVRPEDIYLDHESGTPARVIVVEPTGAETHLAVELGNHELTCVLRERIGLHANETVKLSFRKSALHFFDPVSTNRVR